MLFHGLLHGCEAGVIQVQFDSSPSIVVPQLGVSVRGRLRCQQNSDAVSSQTRQQSGSLAHPQQVGMLRLIRVHSM